jgi:hypothetical protein
MGAGEQTLSANLNKRSRRLPGLRVVPYQPSASAPFAQAFTTGGARADRDAAKCLGEVFYPTMNNELVGRIWEQRRGYVEEFRKAGRGP